MKKHLLNKVNEVKPTGWWIFKAPGWGTNSCCYRSGMLQPRHSHGDPGAFCTSFHKVRTWIVRHRRNYKKPMFYYKSQLKTFQSSLCHVRCLVISLLLRQPLLKYGWKVPCVSKVFFDGAAFADPGWGMRLCWAGLSQELEKQLFGV